mmetsp:Transcript_60678/g.175643  ORF Transcript_60678/g.175643 Transcript_60678/m.175643 type:complete len:102 (+) Transcript_60678:61-366(+)
MPEWTCLDILVDLAFLFVVLQVAIPLCMTVASYASVNRLSPMMAVCLGIIGGLLAVAGCESATGFPFCSRSLARVLGLVARGVRGAPKRQGSHSHYVAIRV